MSPYQCAPWRVLAMCAGSEAMFHVSVLVAYYHYKGGANLGDFLLLQGLFRVALFVLEIPTGFLADKWQRHHQLIASRVCWLASSLMLLFFTSGFWGLLVVELLAALACALRSGTVEAYLHEALVASGVTCKQATTKWQGRLTSVAWLAQSIVAPIGGWLFTLWPDVPMAAASCGALFALAASLTLPKVPVLKSSRHPNPVKDLYLVAHHSLRGHPRLSALILGPFMLFGLTGTLFWLLQTRLAELGVSPTAIGWCMSGYFMAGAFFSLTSGKLLAWCGERLLIAVLPVCLTGGTLLMLTNHAVLVWLGAILGACLVWSLGRTVAVSFINHEVADGERATILSVAGSITVPLAAVYMVSADAMFTRFGLTTTMLCYLTSTLALSAPALYRLVRQP